MAKVKITGHASGTGTITLTAPNTSTDRIVTLPDGTGTLLDENSSLPAANLTGTIASARLPTSTDLPLSGGTMTGATLHGDNIKSTFGAGNDLHIYHDGTNSVIDSNTGRLYIQAGTSIRVTNSDNTENYARFNENGSCQLYYDNAQKISTISTGVDVTGIVTSDGLDSSQKIVSGKTAGQYGAVAEFKAEGSGVKLRIDDNSNASATTRMYIMHNYNRDSGNETCDSSSVGQAAIKFDNGSITFATAAAGNTTAPSNRMTIVAGGQAVIGGVSAGSLSGVSAGLTIRTVNTNSGICFQSGGAATDTWQNFATQSARFYIANAHTANGAYLQYNSSSGWTNVSDQRWKTDWTSLEDSSSKITSLNIGKYHMLNGSKETIDGAKWDYGVKAQELLEVIPDAVDVPENTEDKYGVVPNIVFWYAVKALQEAMTRIETLETQSALFEARLTALEG
jgi:hypothetical protein